MDRKANSSISRMTKTDMMPMMIPLTVKDPRKLHLPAVLLVTQSLLLGQHPWVTEWTALANLQAAWLGLREGSRQTRMWPQLLFRSRVSVSLTRLWVLRRLLRLLREREMTLALVLL